MRNMNTIFSKRVLLIAAALLMLLTGCKKKAESKYKYETVKGDLTEARIYTLDNGLTVYLSVNNEEPRIQTYIAVRTGSKNDPAETTGLAHYPGCPVFHPQRVRQTHVDHRSGRH